MIIATKKVGGRSYRIAAESVWDPVAGRPYSRQVVLGPADTPPSVDLSATRTTGRLRIGDIGALGWAAEQIDVVGILNRVCGDTSGPRAVSIGEITVATAIQRACTPAAKRHLPAFLDGSIPRISCLPAEAFNVQAFHRLAKKVSAEHLAAVQVELAKSIVQRFKVSTDLLAFDTTNFDTHISTTTAGELARRGHAKSKRSDLRVVGLGVLVSETGQVPLFHRTYAGNASDHTVLGECMKDLAILHDALDAAEKKGRPSERTIVRDGGSWGEQLELDFDGAGYFTVVSLPLGTKAAEEALSFAAARGAMKKLAQPYNEVRAARTRTKIGELDRTLVVVESQDLLEGQKRGIAAALKKAKVELKKLERLCAKERLTKGTLHRRVTKALRREHLSSFVVTEISGSDSSPALKWHVDGAKRRHLEKTRLGRRVIATDRHNWSTDRIVKAFRGQWQVEEIFRRAKRGGAVPWGPSHLWADSSLRLHTFATVLGLTLVSLVRLALGAEGSVRSVMASLAELQATMVTCIGGRGRRPTWHIPPSLNALQKKAVDVFELSKWMPSLLYTRSESSQNTAKKEKML